MYQMAPLLREKAGEDRAEELYKEMASTVFKNQPGKVIFDILEDITCVLFTPVSAFSVFMVWQILLMTGIFTVYPRTARHSVQFITIITCTLSCSCF